MSAARDVLELQAAVGAGYGRAIAPRLLTRREARIALREHARGEATAGERRAIRAARSAWTCYDEAEARGRALEIDAPAGAPELRAGPPDLHAPAGRWRLDTSDLADVTAPRRCPGCGHRWDTTDHLVACEDALRDGARMRLVALDEGLTRAEIVRETAAHLAAEDERRAEGLRRRDEIFTAASGAIRAWAARGVVAEVAAAVRETRRAVIGRRERRVLA